MKMRKIKNIIVCSVVTWGGLGDVKADTFHKQEVGACDPRVAKCMISEGSRPLHFGSSQHKKKDSNASITNPSEFKTGQWTPSFQPPVEIVKKNGHPVYEGELRTSMVRLGNEGLSADHVGTVDDYQGQ